MVFNRVLIAFSVFFQSLPGFVSVFFFLMGLTKRHFWVYFCIFFLEFLKQILVKFFLFSVFQCFLFSSTFLDVV